MSFDTNQQVYNDQQIVFETSNTERRIAIGSATGFTDGIEIEYDRLTTPKTFKISPTGVNWNDGTNNYTTGLERLALVQQAFQAVELPPNATTLKLNDTILLSDGTSNTNTINNDGMTITNTAGSSTHTFQLLNLVETGVGNCILNPTGAYFESNITGGVSVPMLTLNQTNTASGSANLTFKKNISTNGSSIGEMSFIAKTAITGNPEREYARIGTTIRSNTGGNVDGAINLSARINDTLTECMRINGQDSQIEIYQPLDLNDKDIVSSVGDIELNGGSSSGSGNIILRPKEVSGTETIKIPLTSSATDEFVIEKSANYTQFYQVGGALPNSNTQMRLGGGGLRLITINPSVAPTLQLDNASFATATHQYSGNNYNLSLPTFGGTLSTTNVSTLSLNSPNTTITNPSGQLNINANTNIVMSGNFNTIASTSNLDIQTPSLVLTGAGLQSGSAGGNSGQHLVITLNGVQYKIALLNP